MDSVCEHFEGRVVDRNDPLGLGRIRAEIPHIFPAPLFSDWIKPWGLFDSSAGRGMFIVPKLNASVVIMFMQGNATKASTCHYMSGPWGRPSGVSDVPSESELGNPDIAILGFDGFALVIDERVGQKKATLLDRTNNSSIQFDIETKDILINSMNDLKKTVFRNDESTISGDETKTVKGKKDTTVTGDSDLSANNRNVTTVADESHTVGGNWKITVTGDAEIKSTGNTVVNADGDLTLGALGNVNVKAGVQTVLTADGSAVQNPTIDGPSSVKIGRNATLGVVLSSIKTWLDTHVHAFVGVAPTVPATTMPPTIPTLPIDYSTKAKAE